jgi:hypothetical protein
LKPVAASPSENHQTQQLVLQCKPTKQLLDKQTFNELLPYAEDSVGQSQTLPDQTAIKAVCF